MTTADTSLSQQQLARAEALDRGRAVLVARAPLSSGKVEFPYELVGLARYIIDGTDVFNTEDADGAVAE